MPCTPQLACVPQSAIVVKQVKGHTACALTTLLLIQSIGTPHPH